MHNNEILDDDFKELIEGMSEVDIKLMTELQALHNDNYSEIYIKDMDLEKEDDLMSGNGFIITDKLGLIKGKAIRTENGIYSPKFGSVWSDEDAFSEIYRCKCGAIKGAMFDGKECPSCGDIVTFKDKNIKMTGWFELDHEFYIIHPNMYKMISSIIGPSRLNAILDTTDWTMNDDDTAYVVPEIDYKHKNVKRYDGIGMVLFQEKFDEILEFFLSKAKHKQDQYDTILKNYDKIFCQSLPVIPLFLRPINITDEDYSFDKLNTKLATLSTTVHKFNAMKDPYSAKSIKIVNTTLYKIQQHYSKVVKLISETINRKNGIVRNNVLGARYNFCMRAIIVPMTSGKINEIHVPYLAFLEAYKPEIIHILCDVKKYNLASAELEWKKAQLKFSKRIYKIMNYIIDKYEPKILLNRNPTLNFGSVQRVKIVHVKESIRDMTISIPVQTLTLLAGDFDGDCTNGIALKELYLMDAYSLYDIRENLAISKDDGLFNSALNLIKEQVITLHDFCQSYTVEITDSNPRVIIKTLEEGERRETKIFKIKKKNRNTIEEINTLRFNDIMSGKIPEQKRIYKLKKK